MANRETSDELSSLAANVMRRKPHGPADNTGAAAFNLLLADAKRLAGSVMSQDEHKGKRDERHEPSAGTSAYELVAATEQHHVETTETLINMIVATVLAKGYPHRGTTTTISPADMDDMHRRFEMTATRDGMTTTVSITMRDPAEMRPSLALHDNQGIDEAEPAAPQVEAHTFDRPLWAARIDGKLFPASDQAQAERMAVNADVGQIAQVENRFCYHADCPAERCNHVEPDLVRPDVGIHPTM